MSNATLDTPWPKMESGKREFSKICEKNLPENEFIEELFLALSDPLL